MDKRRLLNAVFGDVFGPIEYLPSDEAVEQVLDSLNKAQEKQALELRFGDRPMTRKEAGERLLRADGGVGVSHERLRQVEAKALRKLRHPIRARILWPPEERSVTDATS